VSAKQLKVMEAAARQVAGATFEHPGFVAVARHDQIYAFGTANGPYSYDVTGVDGAVHSGSATLDPDAGVAELVAFIERVVDRSALAAWASRSGRGAPRLKPDATRDQLIAWHQWNDPNGEWSNMREQLDRESGGKTWKQADDEMYPDLQHAYDEIEIPSVDELWDMLEQTRAENT
jgi:hypothetical protein